MKGGLKGGTGFKGSLNKRQCAYATHGKYFADNYSKESCLKPFICLLRFAFLADFKALQVQTEQGDWASLEKIRQIFSPRVIQPQPPKKQLRYPGVQVAPVKVNSVNTKL